MRILSLSERVKTTPENVREAHEALFHATMNLPAAAAHCGMTQKELKMTFWEYLKYNEPDYDNDSETMAGSLHDSET